MAAAILISSPESVISLVSPAAVEISESARSRIVDGGVPAGQALIAPERAMQDGGLLQAPVARGRGEERNF